MELNSGTKKHMYVCKKKNLDQEMDTKKICDLMGLKRKTV